MKNYDNFYSGVKPLYEIGTSVLLPVLPSVCAIQSLNWGQKFIVQEEELIRIWEMQVKMSQRQIS